MSTRPSINLADDADWIKRSCKDILLGDLVAKHYGPGPHPGTGTSQDVHGRAVGSGSWKQGRRALHPAELSIRNSKIEIAVVIDASRGVVIGSAEGDDNSVDIPVRLLLLSSGQVFTHNHPGDEDVGWPPSSGDLYASSQSKHSELRVVTKDALYRIMPREGESNLGYLEPMWRKAGKDSVKEFLQRYETDATRAGYRDAHAKNLENPEFSMWVQNRVWEMFADEGYIRYEKIEA